MRLTVMTEYPLCSFHQLGFVDLVKADIILQCTGKNGVFQACQYFAFIP